MPKMTRLPTPDSCTMTEEYDEDFQIYKVVFVTEVYGVTAPITYEVLATSAKDAIKKSSRMHHQWVNQDYIWDVME